MKSDEEGTIDKWPITKSELTKRGTGYFTERKNNINLTERGGEN